MSGQEGEQHPPHYHLCGDRCNIVLIFFKFLFTIEELVEEHRKFSLLLLEHASQQVPAKLGLSLDFTTVSDY